MILIGEHSVVYGYDALALPIQALNITTTVEETDGPTWMDTTHIMVVVVGAGEDGEGEIILGNFF